jgi:Chaperone of endosialidase
MPRDGSGIYTTFVGTDGISGTSIPSTPYNRNVHDVEQDLNTPRPIVAGGTGANNPTDALINLGGELAHQQVVNYDSMLFENGSFWSDASATAAPVAGHQFKGIAVKFDSNAGWITITAQDLADDKYYRRIRSANVWGAWVELTDTSAAALDAKYVNVTGDTMSGALVVNSSVSAVSHRFTDGSATQFTTSAGNAFIDYAGYLELRPSPALTPTVRFQGGAATFAGNVSAAGFTGGANATLNNSSGFLAVSASTNLYLRSGGSSNFIYIGDAGGTALVGNTAMPANAAKIKIAFAGNPPGMVFRPVADADAYPLMFFNAADALVGYIQHTATTTTYATTSDGRLKHDLQTFDAGTILDALQIYNFAWKANGERAYGIVAQEALEVFPDAVTHDTTTDAWGADYSKFVPLLLQEIKALRARVAKLETP